VQICKLHRAINLLHNFRLCYFAIHKAHVPQSTRRWEAYQDLTPAELIDVKLGINTLNLAHLDVVPWFKITLRAKGNFKLDKINQANKALPKTHLSNLSSTSNKEKKGYKDKEESAKLGDEEAEDKEEEETLAMSSSHIPLSLLALEVKEEVGRLSLDLDLASALKEGSFSAAMVLSSLARRAGLVEDSAKQTTPRAVAWRGRRAMARRARAIWGGEVGWSLAVLRWLSIDVLKAAANKHNNKQACSGANK
jgi:hypothetical protein